MNEVCTVRVTEAAARGAILLETCLHERLFIFFANNPQLVIGLSGLGAVLCALAVPYLALLTWQRFAGPRHAQAAQEEGVS